MSKLLVKCEQAGQCEIEYFTRGKNYFITEGYITDDTGRHQETTGTVSYQYGIMSSFYVYTKDEVHTMIDELEIQADGIFSSSETQYINELYLVLESL